MLLELPSKRTFASREKSRNACSLLTRILVGLVVIPLSVVCFVFTSRLLGHDVSIKVMIFISFLTLSVLVFMFHPVDEVDTIRECFDHTYDSVLLNCRNQRKLTVAMQQLKDYSMSRKFHARTLIVVVYESMFEALFMELSDWRRDGWIYKDLPGMMSWDFDDIQINDLEGNRPTHEVYNAINHAPFMLVEVRLPEYQWTPNTHACAPKAIRQAVRAVTIGRAHAHQSCIALLPNELLFKVFECL